MVKTIGALLVISASSCAGFILAARFTERCRLLTVWLRILEIMQTEIFYRAELLPEVFRKITVLIDDRNLSAAFIRLATLAEFGSDREIVGTWENLLAETGFSLRYKSDYSILKEFGAYLGHTDRSDQLEKIKTCKARLEQNLRLAEIEKSRRVGLYRYSGFALGVMLVLWFL